MVFLVLGWEGVAHIGVESAEKGVVVGLEETVLDDFGVFGGVAAVELGQRRVQRPEAAEVALVEPVDGIPDAGLETVVDFLDLLPHLLEVERGVAALAVQQLRGSIPPVVHLIGVVEGVTREVDDAFVLLPLGAEVELSVDLTEVQRGANVGWGQHVIDEGKSRLKRLLFLRVVLVGGDLIGEQRIVVIEDQIRSYFVARVLRHQSRQRILLHR